MLEASVVRPCFQVDCLVSYGVFGRFDLAALCGCHTLNVRYVMSYDQNYFGNSDPPGGCSVHSA